MLEDKHDITSEDVALPTITSVVLRDIIEYIEHFNFKKDPYIEFPLPSSNLDQVLKDPWEAAFIKRFSQEETLAILSAANYLNMPSLFELCCASIGA